MWLKMIPTGLGMTTRTKFGDHTETAHSLTHFTLRGSQPRDNSGRQCKRDLD